MNFIGSAVNFNGSTITNAPTHPNYPLQHRARHHPNYPQQQLQQLQQLQHRPPHHPIYPFIPLPNNVHHGQLLPHQAYPNPNYPPQHFPQPTSHAQPERYIHHFPNYQQLYRQRPSYQMRINGVRIEETLVPLEESHDEKDGTLVPDSDADADADADAISAISAIGTLVPASDASAKCVKKKLIIQKRKKKKNKKKTKKDKAINKPFVCSQSECGASFTKRIYLMQHEVTHNGFLAFRCRHCGKSYKHKRSLDRHQKIH